MRRKLFPVLAACLICSAAVAQGTFVKGYIINLKGDTVKGELKHNPKKEIDLYSKVMLKLSEQDKKFYKPDKIKGYNLNGKVFVSRTLEKELVFMKVISTGAITLYEHQIVWLNKLNEEVVESEYYAEKKGDASPVKIKSGKFKKQICEIMSDNKELIKDVEDKKYEYQNIVDIFEQYNTWAKEQNKG